MLEPRKVKFRSVQKGRVNGIQSLGHILHFGSYAIQALENTRITARQLEATRRVLSRRMKKSGRLWIRVFPDIPVSSKPAEVRMGKGKGSFNYLCCRVKKGTILFELDDINLDLAKEICEAAAFKLPIKTRFIKLKTIIK